MTETQHFINSGFGWTCKRCRNGPQASDSQRGSLARFFTEGEAEEREPALSAPALARWRGDASQRILYCPHCGAEEAVASTTDQE